MPSPRGFDIGGLESGNEPAFDALAAHSNGLDTGFRTRSSYPAICSAPREPPAPERVDSALPAFGDENVTFLTTSEAALENALGWRPPRS